jgi:hypothetical protein
LKVEIASPTLLRPQQRILRVYSGAKMTDPGGTTKFRIWRKPESEGYGFNFNPPLKSDELFFALKEAFPTISTHHSRMAEAVIGFCKSEQQEKGSGDGSGSGSSPRSKASSQSSPTMSPASTPPSDTSNDQIPDGALQLVPWPKPRGKRAHPTTELSNQMSSMVNIYKMSHKGVGKNKAKKPKSAQDLHDYRITKKTGACPRHRRGKHKVRCPPPFILSNLSFCYIANREKFMIETGI